jgi:hypothetical protein
MPGSLMSDVAKKIILSVLISIPSAVVGLVTSKVLEIWGVVSPLSERLGGWLKMHVSPSQAAWTIAGVITLTAYAALFWLVWKRQLAGVPVTDPLGSISRSVPDAPKSTAAPLSIELGTGNNYECIEHFPADGMVKRSIKIEIVNRSSNDIADCNVKLVAATPPLMIGDSKAPYPILFTQNFDLAAGKRKYVKIISLVESGWQVEWQKHSITFNVAVGGWVTRRWTTLSPLPTEDNPGILTFEAFAPAIASSQTQVKIWVDETLGRKLCARIS